MNSLASTFAYLDPQHLLAAVWLAFVENQEGGRYTGTIKASADEWTSHSQFRESLFHRVSALWTSVTEQPVHLFPYSIDAVASIYLRIRKLNAQQLAVWQAEMEYLNQREKR